MREYLAYITPVESIQNKEKVQCKVTFITGDLNHKTFIYVISTDYFRYYYYGTTLEVIELEDNSMNIINIHDVEEEDVLKFGLVIKHALTLSEKTCDIQTDTNVIYNMRQNKMYNYCKEAVENILTEIRSTEKFRLLLFIIDGAIVYIQLTTDIRKNNGYELVKGYVVEDKAKLKGIHKHYEDSKYGKNEKMKQSDIDKLITKLLP
jgi:hypothetical protein